MVENLAGGQQGRQRSKHGRGAEAPDRIARMKFKEKRPYADVDAAAKKLLEIANGLEADHAGRLHVGAINRQFLDAGGSVAEYTAAVKAAVDRGYIAMHPSGAYVTFTQAGA